MSADEILASGDGLETLGDRYPVCLGSLTADLSRRIGTTH